MATEQWIVCPKCKAVSGDDWSQCGGTCPMEGSPHFDGQLNLALPRQVETVEVL